ncbi:response regulator transcription factor [Chitinophaga sp. Cy-1792]|uniref:response regulator transcription factor n=1 Tax=Chitinophaga sp. Cy-1792 TaxID=2608339 RepID=UPI00141F1087|nr:response regulator transcription factor [Chitinophaga sp. Cy-1792]NIG57019.1 response regulator transcription factor [Chitinophaga sp. Cy-1792]
MKPTVLLVEDDQFFAKVVKRHIEKAGYEVLYCSDGQAGWETFLARDIDLCVLDVVMPKKDGFELTCDIRKVNQNVPILITSSRYMEQDRMQGFESGADDYIVKPFNIQEFLMRMEVFIKRARLLRSEKKVTYQVGNLRFDYPQCNVAVVVDDPDSTPDNPKKIEAMNMQLPPKESDLLKYLCENPNKKLKRDQIMSCVWDGDETYTKRTMDVYLTRLRRYIAPDPTLSVETYHGKGIMFIANETTRTEEIVKA